MRLSDAQALVGKTTTLDFGGFQATTTVDEVVLEDRSGLSRWYLRTKELISFVVAGPQGQVALVPMGHPFHKAEKTNWIDIDHIVIALTPSQQIVDKYREVTSGLVVANANAIDQLPDLGNLPDLLGKITKKS